MTSKTIITYQGNLRCQAQFKDLKTEIFTDAPLNIGGQGNFPEPTTLIATALGSCILTVMGIAAGRGGIDFDGARAEVTKEMEVAGTKIKSLKIKIFMPHNNYAEAEKAKLEAMANVCPVKHSLHTDIKIDLKFVYPNN